MFFCCGNRKVKTDAAGIATSICIEFQYKEGEHLKCAIVEFTNGEGGVYAQQTHSLYYTGGNVGYKFMNDDGSLNTITGSNVPGFYGHCGLRTDSAGYSAMTVCAVPQKSSLPKRLWNKSENVFSQTHDIRDVSTLPVLTTDWAKILDGISLQEMVDDEYEISAYLCHCTNYK